MNITPTKPIIVPAPVERGIGSLLFEGDRETMERGILVFQCVIAITVPILNARLIAIPPPLFQGNVLTLPAWLWSVLLFSLAGWWCAARASGDFVGRLWAVKGSFFVCCALCGPVYLRATSFVIPLVFFALFQAAVGVRIQRLKRANDAIGDAAGEEAGL